MPLRHSQVCGNLGVVGERDVEFLAVVGAVARDLTRRQVVVAVRLVAHSSEPTASQDTISHRQHSSSNYLSGLSTQQNDTQFPTRRFMIPGFPHAPVYSLVRGTRRLPRRSQPCRWCGREVADTGLGRRRQYCRQSCRQRAYEQRALVKGTSLSPDAVVLSADEAAELSDRVYQVRCAAEDVATAVEEGAEGTELRELCDALMRAARAADGWR